MNVTLQPADEAYVRRQMESGGFSSADEVIAEGLRLMQERDATWAAEARAKVEVGWSQAKAGFLSASEEVRERLALRKASWLQEQLKR